MVPEPLSVRWEDEPGEDPLPGPTSGLCARRRSAGGREGSSRPCWGLGWGGLGGVRALSSRCSLIVLWGRLGYTQQVVMDELSPAHTRHWVMQGLSGKLGRKRAPELSHTHRAGCWRAQGVSCRRRSRVVCKLMRTARPQMAGRPVALPHLCYLRLPLDSLSGYADALCSLCEGVPGSARG